MVGGGEGGEKQKCVMSREDTDLNQFYFDIFQDLMLAYKFTSSSHLHFSHSGFFFQSLDVKADS